MVALCFIASATVAGESPNAKQQAAAGVAGEQVYRQHCAACHDAPEQTRSRSLDSLRGMPVTLVGYALTEGKMKSQGAQLSNEELWAVAHFISGEEVGDVGWQSDMMCPPEQRGFDASQSAVVTTFGMGLKNQRRIAASDAGLDSSNIPQLELAWALAFPGVKMMRSQPVVVGTTLFITPVDTRQLYAFDVSEKPCLKWVYETDFPLRSSLTYGVLPQSNRPVLVFGDSIARVHMVDAASGEKLWVSDLKRFSQSTVTGTPQLVDGQVYASVSQFEIMVAADDDYQCCKSSGAVARLDGETGEVVWYTKMLPDAKPQRDRGDGKMIWGPSGAPVWTSPAIDLKRSLLYVGTGESTSEPAHKNTDAIVAIDLEDGAIRWAFQATEQDIFLSGCRNNASLNCPPDYSVKRDVDFGASVVIAQRSDGSDVLLAGQKSSSVWALDPDKEGAVVWHWNRGDGTPLGGVHWGLAYDGKRVFVPLNDPGTAQPGYTPHPGLYALDVDSGKLLWEQSARADCEGRQQRAPSCMYYFGFSAAPLVIGDTVAQGSLDGKLQVFDTASGKLLYSFDTLRDFDTVNGVPGQGGAIDNASIVAANGMLYLSSGYGMFGQTAGNVLLAFKPVIKK